MKTLDLKNLESVSGGQVSIAKLASSFCIGAGLMFIYHELQMPKTMYIYSSGTPKKTMKIGSTTIRMYDLN